MARQGEKIPEEKKAEVVSEFLNEPNSTIHEVAAKTSVSKSSVHRIKQQEFGKLGRLAAIEDIIENDIALLKVGQQKVFEAIQNGQATVGEMVKSNSDSTRRYQLLTGGATSRVEGEVKHKYEDPEIEAIVIEAEAKIRKQHEQGLPRVQREETQSHEGEVQG